MLQQCLPLAVLKHYITIYFYIRLFQLQQCLPLAVLKHLTNLTSVKLAPVATVLTACGIETNGLGCLTPIGKDVATVLTACGIETVIFEVANFTLNSGCNSAYRLRY